MYTQDLLERAAAAGVEQAFLELIPTTCPACGNPTTMNPSFTGLSCCDPRCVWAKAQRLVDMCARLGILGLGPSGAEKFFQEYPAATCPVDIFLWVDHNLPLFEGCAESISDSVREQVRKVKEQPLTLADYMSLFFLPGIQTSANPLCEGFSTIEEFYEALDLGGIDFVRDRLGINKASESSLRSMKIYTALLEFRKELVRLGSVLPIKDVSSMKTIRLCISDSAGEPFSTKRAFINEATQIAEENGFHLEFASSVTKTVDVLIYAGGRYTSKLAKAEKLGLPVLSGSEFIAEILKENPFDDILGGL